MNEIPMAFGMNRHLVGTLAMPSHTAPMDVAFLLTNAGVIHRMGPHRFNVKLARHLAKLGVTSFRIDLSGQGDSRTSAHAESFERQSVLDLKAAMDHVERVCGIHKFVIAGICSGAHNGLATAKEDARVVGLCMLDGYVYSTPKTLKVRYVHQLKTRLLPTLGSWAQSAARETSQRIKGLITKVAEPQAVNYGHKVPSRETFAATMQTLLERNVHIYLMYSGSMLWSYNYPEQLQDAFEGYAFVKQVRCDYIPDVDHTATTLHAQKELIDRISNWTQTTYLASAATPPT